MLGLFGVGGFDGVVYFDGGAALKGAQNSIAAGDNLIALFEAAEDFDIGGAGDAGGDGDEVSALLLVVGLEHVDALDELGLGGCAGGSGCAASGRLAAVCGEDFLCGGVSLDERLDGDGEGVGLVGGGDLCGGGEAGAEVVGGLVEGDDDFEVFGFFGAGGALRGGEAGGAEEGLVADLGDVAFEDAAGQGIDGDVDGLVEGDVDDVGLVDFDLGGDDGHVGEGHDGGSAGVLDADDDGLAFTDGDVGDEAIKGGAADGLVEGVVVGALAGDGLVGVAALGVGLGAGLGESGLTLGEGRGGHIVGGFFRVEVLLGDQLFVVEGLGAGEVELLLLEIGLRLSDVGLGGFFRGEKAGDVGVGGGDAGFLGRDGGLGLDVFNRGEGGAGFDVVALFDVEVGDAPEGGGADVDVGHWLDLAGAVDDGDQVLTDGLAGGDLGDAGLSVKDAGDDDSCQDQDDGDDHNNLFSAHCCFLRTSAGESEVLFGEVDNLLRDNTETTVLAFRILSRNWT